MSKASKRDREDNETKLLANELISSVERSSDQSKLKTLSKIIELIDAADEHYEVQKALASEGALEALIQLLGDSSPAVSTSAAEVIAAITQHSSTVVTRLKHGQEVGFAERPEKVNFNPLQEDAADLGAITILVELLFSEEADLSCAASAALAALGSYNRSNKLSHLHELVHQLLKGRTQALEALDTLLDGMDAKDDVAVILDQALLPLLGIIGSGEPTAKRDATILLGTILEKRPTVAEFLRAEGALKPVTNLIITGDQAGADAAVHAMWLLVKDAKKVLRLGEATLGCSGLDLVDPLMSLAKEAAEAEASEDVKAEGAEGEEANGEGGEQEEDDNVYNGHEATLLLKALAAHNKDVKAKVQVGDGSKCCIM